MIEFKIELDVSIDNKNKASVNDVKVITIGKEESKDLIVEDFIVRESQVRYGYLHFPKKSGLQEYIKNGRDILIKCNGKEYLVNNYKPTAGRINGLNKFFADNPKIKEDSILELKLLMNESPMELNILDKTSVEV